MGERMTSLRPPSTASSSGSDMASSTDRRRGFRGLGAAVLLIAMLLVPGTALADNAASGPTFVQLVRAADTVALVTVVAALPDGSTTLRYDHVYKGDAH